MYKFIKKLSPKQLAYYIILAPMFLFLGNTISILDFTSFSQNIPVSNLISTILLSLIYILFGIFIFLWFLWLHGTVQSATETEIGISKKWFKIACIILWIFLVFNFMDIFLEAYEENSNVKLDFSFIRRCRESINFVGIVIAYPLVCFYSARSIIARQKTKIIPLVKTILLTMLLVFGTVLSIPFLHKYFSDKKSTDSQVVRVYIIGFIVFLFTGLIGVAATMFGLV